MLNDRPIVSSEKMLYNDYDRNGSIEKSAGRESQGSWRQDEVISVKLLVVKYLWLWFWMIFSEIAVVYRENHTEHTNTLCGQNI
jgi:hypothetical protein